jgi:predicted DNA-binding protein
MPANNKTASFSLRADQVQRLEEVARKTRISRSVLVREALDRVLDEYETQLPLDFPERAGRESKP